jgi:hypothetical protein
VSFETRAHQRVLRVTENLLFRIRMHDPATSSDRVLVLRATTPEEKDEFVRAVRSARQKEFPSVEHVPEIHASLL